MRYSVKGPEVPGQDLPAEWIKFNWKRQLRRIGAQSLRCFLAHAVDAFRGETEQKVSATGPFVDTSACTLRTLGNHRSDPGNTRPGILKASVSSFTTLKINY